MTTSIRCVRCGAELADGYACRRCALELAQSLRDAAGHAEDAEAVLARQTRYGTGSRGGSDDPLPVDLTAAGRYGAISNTITTWIRVVTDLTGRQPAWRPMTGPTCPAGVRCLHLTCAAIRRRLAGPPLVLMAAWLAQHIDTLRQHPAAGEAFTDLHAACDQLARLVDRPADKELVGVCDCGKILYAAQGRTAVQCPMPTCRLVWDVDASRNILRRHLGDKLVTAAEAARLLAYLDANRTQDAIRKLITGRVKSGQLTAHGSTTEPPDETEVQAAAAEDREPRPKVIPLYRFGDVTAVLDGIPRRERTTAA